MALLVLLAERVNSEQKLALWLLCVFRPVCGSFEPKYSSNAYVRRSISVRFGVLFWPSLRDRTSHARQLETQRCLSSYHHLRCCAPAALAAMSANFLDQTADYDVLFSLFTEQSAFDNLGGQSQESAAPSGFTAGVATASEHPDGAAMDPMDRDSFKALYNDTYNATIYSQMNAWGSGLNALGLSSVDVHRGQLDHSTRLSPFEDFNAFGHSSVQDTAWLSSHVPGVGERAFQASFQDFGALGGQGHSDGLPAFPDVSQENEWDGSAGVDPSVIMRSPNPVAPVANDFETNNMPQQCVLNYCHNSYFSP